MLINSVLTAVLITFIYLIIFFITLIIIFIHLITLIIILIHSVILLITLITFIIIIIFYTDLTIMHNSQYKKEKHYFAIDLSVKAVSI